MLLKNKEMASLKGDDSNENTRDSTNSNSKSHSPPLPTFGLGLTEPKMEQQGYYGSQQQNWNYGVCLLCCEVVKKLSLNSCFKKLSIYANFIKKFWEKMAKKAENFAKNCKF